MEEDNGCVVSPTSLDLESDTRAQYATVGAYLAEKLSRATNVSPIDADRVLARVWNSRMRMNVPPL